MLFTSVDILNITLSISIGVLSLFLVIFLAHLIITMRRANKILNELTNAVKLIDFLRDKIEHGTSHLSFIAEAIKKIALYFIEDKIEFKKKVQRRKK